MSYIEGPIICMNIGSLIRKRRGSQYQTEENTDDIMIHK